MIQIVDHRKFVMDNQPIQQFILDRLPGHNDKLFGTLDVALQRFNTILLKLSQEPLLAEEHNTQKLINADNWFTKIYYRTCLHGIGINRIPKIKKLLNKLDN